MAKKTEVLYDVSQAEKELKKLDDKVRRSGETAKKAFGQDASGGLERFGSKVSQAERKLRKLHQEGRKSKKTFGQDAAGGIQKFGELLEETSPKLANVIRGITKFAGGGGAVAAGFAVAGAAILSTIANVVNLAGQLANIDARLDVINETAERTLKLRDLASSIGDADENRRFEESKRTLDLQEASLAFRENELNVAKQQANQLVNVRKSAFAEIDAAFRKSVQVRQTAEQRLRDKLKEGAISRVTNQFSAQPTGRQIGSLTARAQTEARQGNVEVAEALIEKAKELSNELGNHSFFTKQIEQAQGAVVRALEKDVQTAKTKEGQLAEERQQLQGRVEDAQDFVNVLQKELNLITRQNKELSAQRKLIENAAQITSDVQQQQAGVRQFETGVEQVSEIAGSIGGQAVLGQIRDRLGQVITTIKEGGGRLGTVQEGRRGVEAIAENVARTLDEAFRDEQVTPREVQAIIEQTAGVSRALAVLEKGIADNSLSDVLEKDVNRLKSLFQGLENLGRGAEQFRGGGGGFDDPISASTVQQTQRQVERIIEQRQEIVVNIEGGMIDQATIDQISERIRRELRKETTRGTGG